VLLAPFALLRALGSGFDLRDDGLQRVRLDAQLSAPDGLPDPFNGVAVQLHSTYALLGENWASAGPGQVASRAGGLVPTTPGQSVRALTSLGTAVLSIIEPAMRQFCPGLVNPEIVPQDRLAEGAARGAATGPVTSWRPSC
jgi:hypothetical protein